MQDPHFKAGTHRRRIISRAQLADYAYLLAPGGILLLANHFFFAADAGSRLTRRIHDAFSWSPHLSAMGHHRRSFFLATLLKPRDAKSGDANLGASILGDARLEGSRLAQDAP